MDINHEEVEDPILKWRLCDELTVVQAALLILDVDPSDFSSGTNTLGTIQMEPSKTIVGYTATVTALTNAILAGSLPAKIRSSARPWGYAEFLSSAEETGMDVGSSKIIYRSQPDWTMTTISVNELRNWLEGRGETSNFFFPDKRTVALEYLDPQNESYSHKLAAAVSAWQAVVNDPRLRNGRSVKAAITKWLEGNAKRFGLMRSNGRPNEHGIEEIAKVANWDPKGGAPKTRTRN